MTNCIFANMTVRIFANLNNIALLHYIYRLFFHPEGETFENHEKVSNRKRSTIKIGLFLMIIIELSTIILVCSNEKSNEPNQSTSDKFTISNGLKKSKIPTSAPQLFNNYIIWSAGIGCESENIALGRSYTHMNINITDCFFSRTSVFTGSGGVIYVSGSPYSMSVNFSIFYKCVCSSQGGAIFFNSINSYLRNICANNCSASAGDHFAYLINSQINQVEFLSVSKCSHTTSGNYPMVLEMGNLRVDNTNSSNNNAEQISGFGIQSPLSFTSSHCTLANNNVSSVICIYLHSTSGTISMSFTNIIQNNSPSYGVIYAYGAGLRKMMYCIFHNNQDTLFFLESGSLEVSHSFIDHSGSFSTSNAVSTLTNNTFSYSMTYQIQFFDSLDCNADMKSIDRTIEQSPMRTNDSSNDSEYLFIYLMVCLLIIFLVIIIYYYVFIQYQKKDDDSKSSSSLKIGQNQDENEINE